MRDVDIVEEEEVIEQHGPLLQKVKPLVGSGPGSTSEANSFVRTLVTGFNMIFSGLTLALVVAQYTLQSQAKVKTTTPESLNPDLRNTIGNKGGPILYYNGSGPVPPYDETSPTPGPFTHLKGSKSNETEDHFYNKIIAIVANGSNYTTQC